jgi:hypothetical protein
MYICLIVCLPLTSAQNRNYTVDILVIFCHHDMLNGHFKCLIKREKGKRGGGAVNDYRAGMYSEWSWNVIEPMEGNNGSNIYAR